MSGTQNVASAMAKPPRALAWRIWLGEAEKTLAAFVPQTPMRTAIQSTTKPKGNMVKTMAMTRTTTRRMASAMFSTMPTIG